MDKRYVVCVHDSKVRSAWIEFNDYRAKKNQTLSFSDFRVLVGKITSVGISVVTLPIVRMLVPLNFSEVAEVFGIT